jgi:hypothetical protein
MAKIKNLVPIIISIVLFIILLCAIFYFRDSLFPKKAAPLTSYSYNNFDFAKVDELWYTMVKSVDGKYGFKVATHFSPAEIETFPVEGNLKSFLPVNKGFIAFDPLEPDKGYIIVANGEFALTLANSFKAIQNNPLNFTTVCTKNDYRGCSVYPIVDCNTTNEKVVYLRQINEPKVVVVNENCIIVQGIGIDLIKGVDRILYSWFNVMP